MYLNDALDSGAVGALRLSIEREFVGDASVGAAGNVHGAEPEGRNQVVRVVVRDDVPDGAQHLFVLVRPLLQTKDEKLYISTCSTLCLVYFKMHFFSYIRTKYLDLNLGKRQID